MRDRRGAVQRRRNEITLALLGMIGRGSLERLSTGLDKRTFLCYHMPICACIHMTTAC